MNTKHLWALAALSALLACASGPDPEPDAAPASARSGRTADVITMRELSDPSIGTSNLFEAVRRLRPRFLSSRGPSSINNPAAGIVQVSVDGGPLSSTSVLRTILPNAVSEVRYLNSGEAAQRYGTTANGGGVILVKSR